MIRWTASWVHIYEHVVLAGVVKYEKEEMTYHTNCWRGTSGVE